ncbi:MAG: NUDIX domain-containing protein [Acidimicrobiales bacterium]|jgi:8-oxo-dGTP pyrophosphatase MutT (NUDIX family)
MTEPPLPLRRAVRALMIDHSDRVLMVKLHIEHSGWTGWVLPGGGIEEGEDTETALRRELLEETGLADPFIGPVVCSRTQRGPSVALGYGGQQDEIRLVPCHDFPLAPALEKDDLWGEGIVDMRWFTPAEIHASNEKIVPEGLAGLVDRVLEFGGSVDPLVIDITESEADPS